MCDRMIWIMQQQGGCRKVEDGQDNSCIFEIWNESTFFLCSPVAGQLDRAAVCYARIAAGAARAYPDDHLGADLTLSQMLQKCYKYQDDAGMELSSPALLPFWSKLYIHVDISTESSPGIMFIHHSLEKPSTGVCSTVMLLDGCIGYLRVGWDI